MSVILSKSLHHIINMFTATDELSHWLICIGNCHWQVYSLFSTCNSAVHRHHSR